MAVSRYEQKTIQFNRTMARKLTDHVRRSVGRNDLVVRLPWEENRPTPIGDRWRMAFVLECGNEPIQVGSVAVRVTDRIEVGDISITRQPTGKRKRRR